jgi:hypothetical protein
MLILNTWYSPGIVGMHYSVKNLEEVSWKNVSLASVEIHEDT